MYRGLRAGRNGKNFHILKFRTMVVDADNTLLGALNMHDLLKAGVA